MTAHRNEDTKGDAITIAILDDMHGDALNALVAKRLERALAGCNVQQGMVERWVFYGHPAEAKAYHCQPGFNYEWLLPYVRTAHHNYPPVAHRVRPQPGMCVHFSVPADATGDSVRREIAELDADVRALTKLAGQSDAAIHLLYADFIRSTVGAYKDTDMTGTADIWWFDPMHNACYLHTDKRALREAGDYPRNCPPYPFGVVDGVLGGYVYDWALDTVQKVWREKLDAFQQQRANTKES